MSATPDTADLLRRAIDSRAVDLHTAMPGQVVKVYTASTEKRQFVDVLPCLKRALEDEQGELVEEELPVIPMVPVGYMQGGGAFVSMPLAVGDFVTVIFAERSIDQWVELATKAAQRATSPGDRGTHTLDGAIALPCGPAPRRELLADVHAENVVIGFDGGAQVHVRPDGTIHLGKDGADQYVALANKVATELTALKNAIAGAAVVAGDGGASFKAAIGVALAAWPASVGSTKTKSD